MQTCFVYFSESAEPYSNNFDLYDHLVVDFVSVSCIMYEFHTCGGRNPNLTNNDSDRVKFASELI